MRSIRSLWIAVAPALASSAFAGPSPDQAWLMLREGNSRFVAGQTQHPNSTAARREETAIAQHPFAVVLSCADSRVPVERVFDRGIGDLFVVRVAGNVSATNETASIEYAVSHLETPLVVVMGHTGCGAVNAVVSGGEAHGSIPVLLRNIVPAVDWLRKNRPELAGDELLAAAVEANVWRSIDDLLTRSTEVRDRVRAGSVKVAGAVYDLDSGRVRWLGEHPYQERILTAADAAKSSRNCPDSAPPDGETPPTAAAAEDSATDPNH